MATFTRNDTLYNAPDTKNLYTLSLPGTPGSDSSTKTLLRTEEIKDTIISSVAGSGMCGSAYHNGPTEHNDNRKSIITYDLEDNTKNLIPVIVGIQKKVHEFIGQLMQHSLNVFDQTKILPIFLFININGFSSKRFRDNEPC